MARKPFLYYHVVFSEVGRNLELREAQALHACLHDNDISRLRRLLSNVADINHPHYAFGTPLHVAIWCDNLAAVDVLLHAGADAQAATLDTEAVTCLALAVRNGRRCIFQRLRRHVPAENHANGSLDSMPCLVEAAEYGQACLVSDVLGWWDGWTNGVKEDALLSAAARWHVHVVDVL
ncbi:Uncharacterized protein TPAR_08832 [Tolypocladium paradoxum]|uniref:Uncharacterized protein n=1 Tax=Tolypocladium paradoxum TaxID=94208 RepID=A0A2S4KL88_9HYPO|nr:Uncharacterized protein TPAR_08832 [Tolypocladium paradoxum]